MPSPEIDPCGWSVDTTNALISRLQAPLFPNYENIVDETTSEPAIRDNSLTEERLLQSTDDQIEKSLGIHAVGPKTRCRNDIQQLQRGSAKWLDRASQNPMFQHPNSTNSLDTDTLSDPISGFATHKSHSLMLDNDIIRSRCQPTHQKTTLLLPISQIDPQLTNQKVKITNSSKSQDGDKNVELAPDYGNILPNSEGNQGCLSICKETMDNIESPLPQELFRQHESRLFIDKDVQNIKKVKSQIKKDQAPENSNKLESSSSKATRYAMLKELETIQLARWQALKLPQLELKAHELWNATNDKQSMQNRCLEKIEYLQKRLQVLENEVLNSASSRDLKRMAEILQPTVVDIAVWEWMLNLYCQIHQPEKALSTPKKKPQKRKSLHSDDEIDLSDEGDWADFITDSEDDGIQDDYEDDGFIEDDFEDDYEDNGLIEKNGIAAPLYRVERESKTGKEIVVIED